MSERCWFVYRGAQLVHMPEMSSSESSSEPTTKLYKCFGNALARLLRYRASAIQVIHSKLSASHVLCSIQSPLLPMSSPPVSPTGLMPPPSYRISQNEFDQKTSQALQLSSSTTIDVDEDGWQIYDAAALESVAESNEHHHSPPGSSSAGVIGFGADTFRHEHERPRRPSVLKLAPPTRHMKV
jgi:hypothetical protein